MHTQIAKLNRAAIFLAGISTASIPAMAHADWSIMGLGTLGEYYSEAYGINVSGQVVGYSYSSHAFITGPNGIGMTDLGTLGGHYSYSRASGINNSGQVVGQSYSASGYHAFITGPNGIGMADLGTLGGMYSNASGINDSGQVVGISETANGSRHAFITSLNNIGMTDLGTLGGNYSEAYGINNSGQVVGYSDIAGRFGDFYRHAYITGPDGIGMTDLGTLGGYYSHANGINDSGEAVGLAQTGHGGLHSFIFSHGGITDLSLLAPVVADGWTDLAVNSINNNGQMVGFGFHNGNREAFLLSYTPDTVFTPQPIFIP